MKWISYSLKKGSASTMVSALLSTAHLPRCVCVGGGSSSKANVKCMTASDPKDKLS